MKSRQLQIHVSWTLILYYPQVWYPVTPAMGKPSFDGPECIKEVRPVGYAITQCNL